MEIFIIKLIFSIIDIFLGIVTFKCSILQKQNEHLFPVKIMKESLSKYFRPKSTCDDVLRRGKGQFHPHETHL